MKFRSTVLATALAFAALAVAAQASASCSYPNPPERIPDGTKATKEEMLAGMKTMRAYNDLVAKYTECLQADHDAAIAKIEVGIHHVLDYELRALGRALDVEVDWLLGDEKV